MTALLPKEKDIEKAIIKLARLHGFYIQKVQSGKMMKEYIPKYGPNKGKKKMYMVKLADEGTPDTFMCVPVEITQEMVGDTIGAFVAVEVKRSEQEIKRWEKQKDERSRNQHIQHELIKKAGGAVITTCDFNEVITDLRSVNFIV